MSPCPSPTDAQSGYVLIQDETTEAQKEQAPLLGADENGVQSSEQQEESTESGGKRNCGFHGISDLCKARIFLLSAAALYGTNFALIKVVERTGMPVGLSSTLRFFMAAVATLPWLFSPVPVTAESDENTQSNRCPGIFDPSSKVFQVIVGGLEIGFWQGLGYFAQAIGLETTDASKSAFFCSMAVVVVPILDRTIGVPLLPKQIAGALMALAGVGCLEIEGVTSGLSSGDLWSLVQPIAFGFAFWRTEHFLEKHADDAKRALAAQLLAVFLCSFAFMLYQSFEDLAGVVMDLVTYLSGWQIWLELFWIGVVTTAFTANLVMDALKTLSATEATLILSTEPLWGTFFAILIMGESLGANDIAGAVLILMACLLSTLGMDGIKHVLGIMHKEGDEDAEGLSTTAGTLSSDTLYTLQGDEVV